jgi:flagellar motor switch protein FliM
VTLPVLPPGPPAGPHRPALPPGTIAGPAAGTARCARPAASKARAAAVSSGMQGRRVPQWRSIVEVGSVDGSVSVAAVKPYDLCRPKGLDRNDLRTLRAHFNVFARHAGVELSALLRRNCVVGLTGDLEATWSELAEMMDRRPYLALFTLAHFPGTGMLAMPRDTALRMLELRLGGGSRPPYESYKRLTDCDYRVIGAVSAGIVAAMGANAGKAKRITATLTRQVTDSQVRELANPSDMFVVGCFNLTLGDEKPAEMFVGLPSGVVHQFSETLRAADAVRVSEEEPICRATVLSVPLGVELQIPAIELTPAAIAELAVGDVIRMHHPLARPFELKADGVQVARARVGRSRTRLACVVVEEGGPRPELVAATP